MLRKFDWIVPICIRVLETSALVASQNLRLRLETIMLATRKPGTSHERTRDRHGCDSRPSDLDSSLTRDLKVATQKCMTRDHLDCDSESPGCDSTSPSLESRLPSFDWAV